MASSHYERYLHELNEQAVQALNAAGVPASRLTRQLRLYHTRPAVDLLSETNWDTEKRFRGLERFVANESWLYTPGGVGALDAGRLLEFMTAPKPNQVVRYFKYWAVEDIFKSITRVAHQRAWIYTRLLELVDRRNGIAHGDQSIEPNYLEVRGYVAAVLRFATRTDRFFSQHLARVLSIPAPW